MLYPQRREPGLLEGPKEVAPLELRIVLVLVGSLHEARRHAGALEQRRDLAGRPRRCPRRQTGVELAPMRAPPTRGRELRAGGPRRIAEHNPNAPPLLVVADGHDAPLVVAGARIDTPRR